MAKKSQAQHNNVSNFETLRESVVEAGKAVTEGWSPLLWEQILGISSDSHVSKETSTIDTNKGVVFDAKHHKNSKSEMAKAKYGEKIGAKKPESRAAAAIDYHREIVKSSERSSKTKDHEVEKRVREIVVELRRLISSSKVLQMEFATISVEQTTSNVGEYHINFLEWMLLVIKQAREKVEDSGAWLSAVRGKGKGGKKDSSYWGMFKKHGTTFGQSHERSAATSAAG